MLGLEKISGFLKAGMDWWRGEPRVPRPVSIDAPCPGWKSPDGLHCPCYDGGFKAADGVCCWCKKVAPEIKIAVCPKCNHPHYNMEDSDLCRQEHP